MFLLDHGSLIAHVEKKPFLVEKKSATKRKTTTAARPKDERTTPHSLKQ